VKVAVLDDYQGVALEMADWSPVTERAEVVVFRDHLDDVAALAERLAPFEVVVVMRERTPVGAGLLERLPRLRLLVTTGAGNASIDLAAAAAQGVVVCATGAAPDANEQLAELTWALILAAVRDLPGQVASVRRGDWQQGLATGVYGRTLGLLGVGKIGTVVGRIGTAFGMDVCAWSENLTDERAAAAGVRRVEKAELFERSDIVSLHLRLSERTTGVVGAAELSLMKPSAYLVNTSRGPPVDEPSLVEALRAGRIAGAAIDAFAVEPLPPDHPFRTLPNVIATPHVGYVTRDMYGVFFRDVVEDIAAYLSGAPVRVLTP
jgi:phosphoglycerate dehydrogenase-like enzyme